MRNIFKKISLMFVALGTLGINAATTFPEDGDIITIQNAGNDKFFAMNESGEAGGEGRDWLVFTATDSENVYAQIKVVIKDGKTYLVSERGEGKNIRVVPPPVWPAWVPVADSKSWSKNEQFSFKEVKPGIYKLYSFATESWLIQRGSNVARFHGNEQGAAGWKRSTEDEALLLKVKSIKGEKAEKDLDKKTMPAVKEEVKKEEPAKKIEPVKEEVKKIEVKEEPKIEKKEEAKVEKKAVKKDKAVKKPAKKAVAKKTTAKKKTAKKVTSKTKKPGTKKAAKKKTKPGQKQMLVKSRSEMLAKKGSKKETSVEKIVEEKAKVPSTSKSVELKEKAVEEEEESEEE